MQDAGWCKQGATRVDSALLVRADEGKTTTWAQLGVGYIHRYPAIPWSLMGPTNPSMPGASVAVGVAVVTTVDVQYLTWAATRWRGGAVCWGASGV